MNVFLSVWLRPKETARYIIEEKSMSYVITILTIGYVGLLLSNLWESNLEMNPILLLILCLILAPILGYVSNSIAAWAFYYVGQIFNGVATYKEMFKALSISSIPNIVLLPPYVLWLFNHPQSLMNEQYIGPIPFYFLPTLLLTYVITLWTFGINVAAVAEAHELKIWKALVTVLLPIIVIVIILTLILFLLTALL